MSAIVWLLGAGYSYSLGGPLLTRLLSPVSYRDLGVHYPDIEKTNAKTLEMVRRLYLVGSDFRPGRYFARDMAVIGEPLWENAESFIEYLDSAATQERLAAESGKPEGPRAVRIRKMLKQLPEPSFETDHPPAQITISDLHAGSRMHIAAECCAFLRDADTAAERWSPYVRWGEQLSAADTIITFNYDRAVEMLDVRMKQADGSEVPKVSVLLPGDPLVTTRVSMLKLHGSVDWERTDYQSPKFEISRKHDFAVDCVDSKRVLGTPGPSKHGTASGELAPLWDHAKAQLTTAETIVFLGYRFPPTDSYAREQLLTAIGQNTSTNLCVHIVLNADVPNERRLEGLLEHVLDIEGARARVGGAYAARRYSIRTHPLSAEDFLAVFNRRRLTRHPGPPY